MKRKKLVNVRMRQITVMFMMVVVCLFGQAIPASAMTPGDELPTEPNQDSILLASKDISPWTSAGVLWQYEDIVCRSSGLGDISWALC